MILGGSKHIFACIVEDISYIWFLLHMGFCLEHRKERYGPANCDREDSLLLIEYVHVAPTLPKGTRIHILKASYPTRTGLGRPNEQGQARRSG
jgi:hypothetical protein